MGQSTASLHDAYAADYDRQVSTCDCHISDVLFGLFYEYLRPGEKLLDAGIGSGLSSIPFARAGMEIHGMDFSPVMLALCQQKKFTTSLVNHNLLEVPWSFPDASFAVLVCCGVFHFIPDLVGIFGEVQRVLKPGGIFAFTTKVSPMKDTKQGNYDQQTSGEFEIYSHFVSYLEKLVKKEAYTSLKRQRCFIGEDIFTCWVVRRRIR
jgi:ubiquinone/menaquinone biosynthesis C-methylase UbiE